MKEGYVSLHLYNVLTSGVAGSGKSNVAALILGLPPPSVRNSTSCLEKPVCLHIRPVSSTQCQVSESGWTAVKGEELLLMLGNAIHSVSTKSDHKLSSELTTRMQRLFSKDQVVVDRDHDRASQPIKEESVLTATECAVDSVIGRITEAVVQVQSKGSFSKADFQELFNSVWVYLHDCGGQPQFHDVSPLFTRSISAALLVSRLIDSFDSFPSDEYYRDDKLVGLPLLSHMTIGDTLKSLLRSIESRSVEGQKPRPIFVGTHLDLVATPAAVDERNEELLDMLTPEVKGDLVYSDSAMKHPIFAVNATSRDQDALDIAKAIRDAVEGSLPSSFHIPIWWYTLELFLRELCSVLGRGVLSLDECLVLSRRLEFQADALIAALEYFDEVCIAHYYRKILPGIVFVDAQVPLDKITELTQHAISLRESETSVAVTPAKWKRFRDEGIVTLDILNSEHFQSHYVEGIFTPADLVKIMLELLVIAPVVDPLHVEADCVLPSDQFIMPSLRSSLPPLKLQQFRICSPTVAPLLLRFPSGCIRSGVVCCLVVYLIKHCEWSIQLSSGEPVLISRNCVKFRVSKYTCNVIVIDSFAHLEVYLNGLPSICPKVCTLVLRNILDGIKAAYRALHYSDDHPDLAFFCPHDTSTESNPETTTVSTPRPHVARVNVEYKTLMCTKDADVFGELKPRHTVWLPEPPQSKTSHHASW